MVNARSAVRSVISGYDPRISSRSHGPRSRTKLTVQGHGLGLHALGTHEFSARRVNLEREPYELSAEAVKGTKRIAAEFMQ